MSGTEFSAKIDHLKSAQRWQELSTLYEQLSAQESNLEQRLYFDWERATLLATELHDPAGAIMVLKEAAVIGGPIELIAPQIEAIRQAALDNFSAQEGSIEAFKALSQRAPLSRITIEMRAWTREAESLLPSLEPPFNPLSPSVEDSLPDEENDDLDASLLEEDDIIAESISPKVLLAAQNTKAEDESGAEKLRHQLSLEASVHEPLRFMNDLLALSELGEINDRDRERYEPLLWSAASKSEQWRLWVKVYEKVYLGEGELKSESEVSRTYTLASILELKLNDTDRAAELYALVLDHEPNHDEAFDRLRTLLKAQKRWDELGKLLLKFASTSGGSTRSQWSDDARFEMCLEAGDCFAQHLSNYAKAITAWFAALEVNPDSKQIFVRLVEVYQKSQKWSACIKVLRKLSTLEEDHTKAAFHLYTIGLIQRDQLRDHYLAVRNFDEALDIDPHFIKAFQEIDDTLEREDLDQTVIERRDRYYRKMLIRAVENHFEPTMIASLAMQVGEINGRQLNRWQEARQAYELVLEYEPSHDEAHAQLIESIARTDGPQACLPYVFDWVRCSPQQSEPYVSFFERAFAAQKWDQAWCAAMTLRALEHLTPEALRHLEAGRDLLGSQFSRPLSAEEWRSIEWANFEWGARGDEWGTVMEVLGVPLLEVAESGLKSLGLHPKKDRIVIDNSNLIGRVTLYVSQSFNLTPTPIWLSSHLGGQLMLTRVQNGEIALILNREVISQLSVDELACTLTVGLILSQKNTAIMLSPHREQIFKSLTSSLSSLSLTSMATPALSKESRMIQEIIDRLETQKRKLLSDTFKLIDQNAKGPDLELDSQPWFKALEQTAYRAALLTCSDPSLVHMLIKGLPRLSDDEDTLRIQRLSLFSVSPQYLTLRERLGINWGS